MVSVLILGRPTGFFFILLAFETDTGSDPLVTVSPFSPLSILCPFSLLSPLSALSGFSILSLLTSAWLASRESFLSILCATLGSGGPGWCFSVVSESCRCCDCSSTENDSSKEGLLRLFLPFPSSVSMGIPLSSSSPLLPEIARSLSSFLLSSLSSWNRSAVSSCLYFCLSSELVGLSDPFSGCLPQGVSALWGLQSIL